MFERLAVILAVFLQAAGLVWYVSTLHNNVELSMREIARHEVRIAKLEETSQQQALTMARIDENIKSIRSTLEQMAAK